MRGRGEPRSSNAEEQSRVVREGLATPTGTGQAPTQRAQSEKGQRRLEKGFLTPHPRGYA
jgi:hypothetical protein